MKLHWVIGEKDIALLKELADGEVKAVATKYGMSPPAVYAWLYRIRARVDRYQTYLNKIRTLQRVHPRIRKFTTIGKVKVEEEEEEWVRVER